MFSIQRLHQILLGYFVYLLAILDIPVESFEKGRFHLRELPRIEGGVSNENDDDNDDGDDTNQHETIKDQKKILFISFAGATFLVGGFPRAEFQKVLSQAAESCGVAHCTNYLFLTDPSVTFYLKSSYARRREKKGSGIWEGWDELVEKLNHLITVNQYDKVIAIGSSMGATAILALCGKFLKCDRAIIFNPLVEFRSEWRIAYWIGGMRLPRKIRSNLPKTMARQCCDCAGKVVIHSSKKSRSDAKQLKILQKQIKIRQQLAENSSEMTEDEKKDPPPVIKVVLHDTNQHVLPRELKKDNQLLPLIVDALREVLKEKDQ